MIVGSGTAWAEDQTNVTINFGTTTGCWAAHSSNSYVDSDSRTWTRSCSVSNMSGQSGYSQFGNASNTCGSLTFTATAGSDIIVTSFSVTMAGASGGNSPTEGTIYLYKITSGGVETQLASASVSGTNNVTCSISSNQAFSSTDILKVSYTGTKKAIRVSKLSYSYTNATAEKENPTITFNNGSVHVGKTLDLSTLFSSNSTGAVTYSITAGDDYASIDGSTLTGVAEGSVTVKAAQAAAGNYNAGEAFATITVNPALILSSIAITTPPTKTVYTEGETFDPTGMVVTATYSDSSTGDVTASCTYTPSTSTALTTSDTEITVSYTENAVEKTTTQAITVNALPKYTVTFSDGGSVTQESYGASVTLPSRSNISDYTFTGWSETNVAEETTIAPTIIPAGSYTPTGDITLYPVYKKTEGASAPSSFSIGDTGNFAIVSEAFQSNGKYYALPTTPTVNSGKITAEEITISEMDGVKYVTPANATGFTWTIAAATNGYTLSDGSHYIYHSNGGSSGTNLTYGDATTYTWAFTSDGDYIKMAGMNGSTTNTRGMLFSGTTIGGYALSNWGSNGYYKTMILPISEGATIYYWSSPVEAAVKKPVITVAENPFLFSTNVEITCETDGATIYYTLDGTDPTDASTEYSDAFDITSACTIKAIAIKGSDESSIATLVVEKNQAEPTVTVSGDLTVDLNGETDVNAGTLTAAVTYNEAAVDGATVTWISSDPDVATIGENTGVVTIKTRGSVTFTATYAGNSDYAEATGTKTITVTDSKAPGTQNNPYTVAQAIAATPASGTSANFYIRGVVSAFYGDDITNDNYHRYYISDDGSTTNQLLVFNGKGLNNEAFSNASDLQIGDEVVILGGLTTYSNAPEVAANNYIVTLNRVEKYTLTYEQPEHGTITVTDEDENPIASGTKLEEGTTLIITATANTGYTFSTWTATAGSFDEGNATKAETFFTTAAEDMTLSAEFTVNSYQLSTLTENGTLAVTVDGVDKEGDEINVNYGQTVSITAIPATNYIFATWECDGIGEYSTTENPLEFVMPDNAVEVIANFNSVDMEYDIDVDDEVTGGTISADLSKAKAGQTVTLTSVPAEGYVFGEWTVLDGEANEVTVTDNKFTMPFSNVTVSAVFKKIHTVMFVVAGADDSVERVDGVTLSLDDPDAINGMAFAGWSTSDDATAPVFVANDAVVNDDMILYAMFTAQEGANKYVKQADGTIGGEYLIVYEDGAVAFDGSLETLDDTENTIGVEINNGEIAATATVDAATFTISAVEGGYSIQSASGKYIGQTSNANGLATSDENVYVNTIEITGGDADIVSGGAYLRYNSSSNQLRFRYYKSSSYTGQKAIQLYKKVSSTPVYSLGLPSNVTITAAAQYAAFSATQPVSFDGTDVTVYTVTYEENKAKLHEVTDGIVPANTGVILFKEVDENAVISAAAIKCNKSSLEENDLLVSDGTVVGDGTIYALANKTNGVGFYRVKDELAVPAGKPYLVIENASAREFISFFEEGGTPTGIHTIATERSADYYNLNGQRVETLKKGGLYIQNGKKVIFNK